MRDNILRLVLGDRLIHIQHVEADQLARLFSSESINTDKESAQDGLYSAFCVAEKSEQEAYDEVNRSFGNVQMTEDPYYIEPYKDRHKNCLMRCYRWSDLPAGGLQAERLTFSKDLSILAVCRLLYEESNNVLWQTNTFSFDNDESFRLFNASMNPSQKHKLKKIHFSMDVIIDSSDRYQYIHTCKPWAGAIVPRILTPLKNLKVLHLSFNQYCTYSAANSQRLLSHTDSQHYAAHQMETMLGLRMLPWKDIDNMDRGKHVTVIVGDDASTHSETITPRWTKAEKLEAAEKLRARLAAPNSAFIHKEEEVAAKVSRERAERRFAPKERRAIIRCLQARTENYQRLVDEAQETVEDCRADVDGWTASKDQLMKDGAKIEDTLEEALARSTAKAEVAETRHEKLSGKLVDYQADLASFLADPKHPPGKYGDWVSLQAYFSD